MGTIGYTWYPTELMRNLKYFLVDASKQKSRVHQLDFIEALIRSNVKHIFFKSWTVDMEINSQNIATILEEH